MKICNFCGKSLKEVRLMIAGTGSDICDECVFACMDSIMERLKECIEVPLKKEEVKL